MKYLIGILVLGLAASALNAATFVVTTSSTQLPAARFVESYAFSTESAPLIAAIRARIAAGQNVAPLIRIAPGADGINRNYLAPGAPERNWHVVEVLEVEWNIYETGVFNRQRDHSLKDMEEIGVQQLIDSYETDQFSPRHLTRVYEITPGDVGQVVNVSNRGRLGTGDAVLIAGFVVQGTTPRLVLARAMGPSLAAYLVPGAAANPLLRLYRGSTLVAENDNWQEAARTDSIPAGLVPGNALEAAVVVVLEPGVYTAHGSSPDQGIGLIEVYDLSGIR